MVWTDKEKHDVDLREIRGDTMDDHDEDELRQRELMEGDEEDEYLAEPVYENADAEEHIYEEPRQVYHSNGMDDIVHSDLPAEKEEERPPHDVTRSLLAKFRSMEDVSAPPPSPQRSVEQQKVAYSHSTSRSFSTASERHLGDGEPYGHDDHDHGEYYHNQQDYEQYEQEGEGGEYENDPFVDPDLVREGDNPEEEELPEVGMTQNLLAKFQSIQAAHS